MLARVLSRTFDVYGQHFPLLVGWTAAIVAPLELALLALQLASPDTERARIGLVVIDVAAQLLIVTPLATVLCIRTAQASARRERPAPARYLANGFELLPAIALVIAIVAAITVPLALMASAVALPPIGTVVGLIGIVLLLLACTRLSLAIPALIVEDRRGLHAARRSLELVRGATGRVLAVLVVLALIALVIAAIGGGLTARIGGSHVATSIGERLAALVTGVLTAPVIALGQFAIFSERAGETA